MTLRNCLLLSVKEYEDKKTRLRRENIKRTGIKKSENIVGEIALKYFKIKFDRKKKSDKKEVREKKTVSHGYLQSFPP